MLLNKLLKPLAWLHRLAPSSNYLYVGAGKVISRFNRSRVLGWIQLGDHEPEWVSRVPALVRRDLRKETLTPLRGIPAYSVESSKVAAAADYAFLVARPLDAPESLDPEDLYRAAKFLRETARVYPSKTHVSLRVPKPGNKWDPCVLCLREARSNKLVGAVSVLPPWTNKDGQ